MLKLLIFVYILGAAAAGETDCYENGVDYIGTNINNGLEQHTKYAAECQVLCQVTLDCLYFSWVDSSFPDPSYQLTCWLKSGLTGRKHDLHVISGPRLCSPDETTTKSPTTPPPTNCHHYLWLGGPEANGIVGYAMGYMKKQDGKSSYKQIQGQHILQYKASRGWVVTVGEEGDVLAYTEDPASCVYEATSPWWYLNHGQWVSDPNLHARVSNEERCIQDGACAGCGFMMEWDGHYWCCSSDCDYGWIDILWNGGYYCKCGH